VSRQTKPQAGRPASGAARRSWWEN
jgi:hypothetical protein